MVRIPDRYIGDLHKFREKIVRLYDLQTKGRSYGKVQKKEEISKR